MKPTGILIRRPKDEDFRVMAEIKVRGWQTAYHGIIEEGYLQKLSVEPICEKLREKNDLYLVAETSGEIIGFCRYRMCEESDEQGNCSGAISELYVKPELKRLGTGGALFQRTLEELKGGGCVIVNLGCFSENTPAISFYKKMKGKLVGKENMIIGAKEYSIDRFQFVL